MDKKFISYTTLIVLLSLFIPSCTRIASLSPVATATGTPAINFPVGTLPALTPENQTQTALASGIGAEMLVGTATPKVMKVVAPTNTRTPTEVVVTTTTPGHPSSYVLKYGEWPICIARRFNLDIDELFALNGLNMNSHWPAGAVLTLPGGGSWDGRYGTRAWHAHPTKHTIAPGENINAIACYYGDVTPESILSKNGLSGAYTINVGQVLDIP